MVPSFECSAIARHLGRQLRALSSMSELRCCGQNGDERQIETGNAVHRAGTKDTGSFLIGNVLRMPIGFGSSQRERPRLICFFLIQTSKQKPGGNRTKIKEAPPQRVRNKLEILASLSTAYVLCSMREPTPTRRMDKVARRYIGIFRPFMNTHHPLPDFTTGDSNATYLHSI